MNTEECSYHGIYKCGICECDSQYFGGRCECSPLQQSVNASEMSCRPDNTSTVDCSGRGSCVCGQCECNIRTDEEVCKYVLKITKMCVFGVNFDCGVSYWKTFIYKNVGFNILYDFYLKFFCVRSIISEI